MLTFSLASKGRFGCRLDAHRHFERGFRARVIAILGLLHEFVHFSAAIFQQLG